MTPTYRSTTVAEDWEHGLVAGDGSLGLMLFGHPGGHRVTLSHERVLLPADPPRRAPLLAPHLSDIRRLIDDGRAQDAAELGVAVAAEEGYPGLQWTDPLVPVASIELRDDPDVADEYERRVDLDTGEIELAWRTDGAERVIRGFVSRADGIAVLEVPASTAVELVAPDNVAIGAEGVRGGNQSRVRFSGGGPVEVEGALDLRFVAPWDQPGAEGAVTHVRILARTADGILLGVRVDPVREGGADAEAPWPAGGYDALLTRHRAARRRTVAPAEVRLGVLPSGRSTEVLLDDGSSESSRELLELQLRASASLIDASTGEFAPTLQGIWSGTFDPAWSSDYTMNGNVQNGAVAATLTGGAPHQLRTWVDMLAGFADDLRDNAERLYAASGFLLPSRCSIRNGRTTHFDATHCHEFWTAGTAWAAAWALDEIWFTADLGRLRSVAYPFAREAERFYETFLQTEEGRLLFSPSYSPENSSPTFGSQACRNATQDRAALAVLLKGLLRASTLLDVDRHLDGRRRGWLDALPPYRIALDGTLAEWLDEGVEEVVGHRTASQLYELWFEPGPELTSGPLADAVRATVRGKLAWRDAGNESMAYGLQQLGLAAAAVGDGELALDCATRLSRVYSLPSLSFTHNRGTIFNLDAAGSLPSIVHGMLVGSTVGRIELLPAIPAEWESGSATSIHARGAVVVEDLHWSGGAATARIRALPGSVRLRRGSRLDIRLGATTRSVDLRDDETVDVEATFA